MTRGSKPSDTYTRHFSGKFSRLLWSQVFIARTSLGIGISTFIRRAVFIYAKHPELWDAAQEYATPEELAAVDGEIGQA